ncbi:MAG TPA: radical SAM protein [Elusimicrobiota bacterium]|nr:radical SAM protein [Elusimicrobiota bacterium]
MGTEGKSEPPFQPWWKEAFDGGPSFTWDLHNLCNYRCSYCWWEQADQWQYFDKKDHPIPWQAWLRPWSRMNEKYGRCRLHVLGGEPLLYPGVGDLFAELSKHHYLYVATNLSSSLEELKKMTARWDASAIYLNASFHPEFAAPDLFLKKLLYLRSLGFTPSAAMVSYPPHIPQMTRIRELLAKEGIPITFQVFQGKYQGKSYPESFSVEERALLDLEPGTRPAGEGQPVAPVEQPSLKGKPCCAGWFYANVKADGEVFRCGGTGPGMEAEARLGNLFGDDFELLPAPAPCPARHCFCQENIFLLEAQEKKQPEFLKAWARKTNAARGAKVGG